MLSSELLCLNELEWGFLCLADSNILQEDVSKGGTVMGTGHNMLITMPDGKMYTVYHARMQADPSKRVVFMDQVTIQDGKLKVSGPTTSEQKIAYWW